MFTGDETSLISQRDALAEDAQRSAYSASRRRTKLYTTLIICASVASVTSALCYAAWSSAAPRARDTVLACYYNTPRDNGSLQPAAIPPHLCTHINVAFASVVRKQIVLRPAQADALRRVVALRRHNPALKVLLSVGGAGADDGFPDAVADHASRKTFIRSLKATLRRYELDGVDLDWEFPGLHGGAGAARERQHFSQLLREIRAEYARERRPYLLTVALAAPPAIVDVSYDVDQIDLHVDFANLMTYDYHYYSRFTPFTGLNSPLYRRRGEALYPATLNVNHTVHLYAARGLRRDKIVVGVPTYGHSFTLVNAANAAVGAPASGFGALGGGGFVDCATACRALEGGASVRWAGDARAPFLFRGREWLSFESARSVRDKAAYAAAAGVRGAMLYSLDADDHAAACATSALPFPLARAVRRALGLGHPPAADSGGRT